MKYSVVITKTGIQGECYTPSDCNVEIYNNRERAVAKAMSLFSAEIQLLIKNNNLAYTAFDTYPTNGSIVEARIFGELDVIVIGVKPVKEEETK